jgi:hypothetical protein
MRKSAGRVEDELDRRLDAWLARAQHALKTGARLGYQETRDSNTVGLLEPADGRGLAPVHSAELLRDVEPTVGLILQDGARFVGEGADGGGGDGAA